MFSFSKGLQSFRIEARDRSLSPIGRLEKSGASVLSLT